MAIYTKAFKPLGWLPTFDGISEDTYKKIIEGAELAFISCDTELGKTKLDAYLDTVTSSQTFTVNMLNLLRNDAENAVIVNDTSLLLGYVLIDQLTGVIKYYMDYRFVAKLKSKHKAPRTAEEIFVAFKNELGFVPVKYKVTSMIEIADDASHKFSLIKSVLESGENSDMWSNIIKIQILAGLNRLDYTPSLNKYYFIIQGKRGWYLKADVEKNESIKQRKLEMIARKEAEQAESDLVMEDNEVVTQSEEE